MALPTKRQAFWTTWLGRLRRFGRRRGRSPLANFLIAILASSIPVAAIWFIGFLRGPENYRIYFVGAMQDPAVSQIHKGITQHKLPPIDDIPVVIDPEDDKGDLNEAERCAREIARSRDVIMVVGHGYSSTSKRALPEYLAQQPKIPVILVRETNPDLLPSTCNDPTVHCPVFRLSPTDDEQAKTAVRFAIQKGATSFLLVKGTENPVYSNFLANQFVRRIRELGKSVLSITDSEILHPKVLKALAVDCVFYVGEYHKALELIKRTKEIYEQIKAPLPTIILSDWSANPELPRKGGKDIEGVFLTHPRSAAEIGDKKIGYRYYGLDTASILEKLIMETERILSKQSGWFTRLKNFLKMRSVDDVRQALAQAMIQLRSFRDTPSGEEYDFDLEKDGHLKGGQFHVWMIKDGKYKEVPQDR